MRRTPGKDRYLLYTHWGVGNKNNDIKKWEDNSRSPIWLRTQPVHRYLSEASEHLTALLEETGGLLVLFFDPGWKLALKPPPLKETEQEKLEQAEAYAAAVWALLAGALTTPRVRIQTVKGLQDFIRDLRERDRPKIHRWFVGDKGLATYDSPKVIEAFLRVRLLGSGIPVLRVDWDVLINVNEDHEFEQLGVKPKAIDACLTRYDEERTDIHTRTWICSAGYRRPNKGTYDAWSRGFATRIQPALLATPEMCQLVCGWNFELLEPEARIEPQNRLEDRVTDIVQESFDLGLVKQYIGLEEDANSWEVREKENNIATLGAHPLLAVISGALLNLSASALLDLPPFSNMTRGVMWIDDHLKFELHRALGHLRPNARATCRIPVSVVKGREAPRPNLAAYTWASYMPTLLLGLVMDAWIRKEAEEEEDRPLVKGLKQAIMTGDFGHRTGMKLERRLREVAIDRISRVHDAWSKLKDTQTGTHTLASAWTTSEVSDLMGKYNLEAHAKLNPDSRGLGLIAKGRRDIRAINDLRPVIQDELRELIWDAVDYIHLTVAWPGMIQTIRAVEQDLVKLQPETT